MSIQTGAAIPLKDASPIAQALGEYMSFLSEDRWSSGWLNGIEYELWEAVVMERPSYYGDGQIWMLRQLTLEADGWVAWSDEHHGEVFVPRKLWLEMVAAHKSKAQG